MYCNCMNFFFIKYLTLPNLASPILPSCGVECVVHDVVHVVLRLWYAVCVCYAVWCVWYVMWYLWYVVWCVCVLRCGVCSM